MNGSRPRPSPLQAHRTALSWLRLGFTAAVAAVLAMRVALQERDPVLVAATITLVAVLVVGALAYRSRGRGATLDAPPSHHALPRTALAVSVLTAVSGLLIVVAVLI